MKMKRKPGTARHRKARARHKRAGKKIRLRSGRKVTRPQLRDMFEHMKR